MNFRDAFGRSVQLLRRRFGLNLFRIYVRPMGCTARIPTFDGLQVRALTEAEVAAHFDDPQMDLRRAQVRGAFARGDRCLGAFLEGRLVGYTWLAYGPTPHIDGVWADIGPDVRYSYKTFVHPSHRGKRVSQAMHAFANDLPLRRGKRYALDCVDLENFASFAALERTGSRVAGFAGYVQLFGGVLSFSSPGAQRWGFRFFQLAPQPFRIPHLRESKRSS